MTSGASLAKNSPIFVRDETARWHLARSLVLIARVYSPSYGTLKPQIVEALRQMTERETSLQLKEYYLRPNLQFLERLPA